ncbi:MAG TPA: aspartate/glutamate racemase family protein [Candidatus Angelobacter sp.]|nr:aspartate/glutamate racemase family protein [Candidatus Angelobacter sp.]
MKETPKTIGIIHAIHLTIRAMQPFLDRYIPDVEVIHLCDDTIQRDNISAGVGVIPKHNYFRFAQYAHNLQESGVELILLACSTFNYAAELARPMIDIPILQIDRPMMELAVSRGHRVGLLATLATTVPSSERLLKIVAAEKNSPVEITTVLRPEAFAAIQKGDTETHNRILLEEIDKLSGKVDSIVMAQLSMSALEPYLGKTAVPVYNSGATGFGHIRQLLYGAVPSEALA